MKEETNYNNKLIAEFMGCYGDTMYVGGEPVFRYGFKHTHITDRWHPDRFIEATPYHENWNWLMTVVDKIESLGYFHALNKNQIDGRAYSVITDSDHKSLVIKSEFIKIDACYRSVVEFIEWYNSTSNQQ